MPSILTFDQALADAGGKRHLLLGNGFSIAWKSDVFHYGAIYGQADFSSLPYAEQLFGASGTRDFEVVIRNLKHAAKTVLIYPGEHTALSDEMLRDAELLKNILVTAIATSHPGHPDEVLTAEYQSSRRFLANFERIYSLNYDLLLYWALMHNDVDTLGLRKRDGFTESELIDDAPYVAWGNFQSATVYYLHGALHIFDSGSELKKYTWKRTNNLLMSQIRDALDRDLFPLFVSEGESEAKLSRINHSGYLHKALRSFSEIQGSLFIYGHSLAANDEHILRVIEGGKVNKVYVSIFGDPNSTDNCRIVDRAELLQANRTGRVALSIYFFDAASAKVWRG